MLKPVTEQEKTKFTLTHQLVKSVEELLSETYESGYNGYVTITATLGTKRNNKVRSLLVGEGQEILVFDIKLKKLGEGILSNVGPRVNKVGESTLYLTYHVCQEKGCKLINSQ